MEYYEIRHPKMVRLVRPETGEPRIIDLHNKPTDVSLEVLVEHYVPVGADRLLKKIAAGFHRADVGEYSSVIRTALRPSKVRSLCLLIAALLRFVFWGKQTDVPYRRLVRAIFMLSMAWGKTPERLILEDTREIYDENELLEERDAPGS